MRLALDAPIRTEPFVGDLGSAWAGRVMADVERIAPELRALGPDEYGNAQGSGDDLTGRWRHYNLFNRSTAFADAASLVGELATQASSAFDLHLDEIRGPLARAWANIWYRGHAIAPHVHYSHDVGEEQRCNKLAGNVYLGGDAPTTTDYFIDGEWCPVENVAGRVTIFDARLIHRVKAYQGRQRMSVGMNLRTTPDFSDDEAPTDYVTLRTHRLAEFDP